MTAIATVSSLTLVHALGWTLLHFCWQGALIALLLACILAILPQKAPALRYAAASAAMALMFSLPLITFGAIASRSQQSDQAFAISIAPQARGLVLDSGVNQPAQPWTMRFEQALNRSLPWVIGFWLAGVILLLCRLNLGLMATRRMRLGAVKPGSQELDNTLRRLRACMGIQRAVGLMSSARVQIPIVIGWLKPLILVPTGCMAGLSPQQVEAILAHELAHVRRHDYLVNLFQSAMETLLFYHPAVWWVSACMRRERENCCDDLAIAATGDRLTYARALSRLAEMHATVPAGAFAANGGVLKMRIARLLGVNQSPTLPRAAAIALLIFAGAAAGLAARGAARPQSDSAQQAALKAQFRQWIDQDVRWIISAQEKQAFHQLTTDQERMKFIQQFWDVRNPDPGSPRNKFKEEHYRRIAFANQHFIEQETAGWATDRGHVYIVFGPPDSIEAHPSGGNDSTMPFEVWHYRSIQIASPASQNPDGSFDKGIGMITREDVDFRFVDACSCGRYQLRSPWPSVATSAEPEKSPLAVNNTVPGIQLLSDTEGVNFSDWLMQWRAQTEMRILNAAGSVSGESGKVTVRFKVLPDGKVMDGSMVLEQRSGDPALDRIVWNAVTGSQYPPLPSDFDGPYLELRTSLTISASTAESGGAKALVQPSAGTSPPANPADIVAQVSAGAPFTLAAIQITGNRALQDEDLLDHFPLHIGDRYNAAAVGQGLSAIMKLYVAKGYTRVRLIPSLQRNEPLQTLTLRIEINEGT